MRYREIRQADLLAGTVPIVQSERGPVVLFLHLSHGIQSFLQTLGLHHDRYTPLVRTLSWVLAALVAGGNVMLSLSVVTGIVKVAS